MGPNDTLRSPFTEQELERYRQILMAKATELSEDIATLIDDARTVEAGGGVPTHLADRGTETDIQEQSFDAVENEEELLWQIKRALAKIDSGKPIPYGICEHTRKPIPKRRLDLLPWTPLSVEGVQQMEDEGLTLQDMIVED